MTLIKNDKGVSLFELLVAILIGSMVISMLMSVLVMGISAKAKADYTNRLFNDSYYIGEYIKKAAFELEVQDVSWVESPDGRHEESNRCLRHQPTNTGPSPQREIVRRKGEEIEDPSELVGKSETPRTAEGET